MSRLTNKEEALREALSLIAHAADWVFPIENDARYTALCFMIDNCLKYGESIFKNVNPLNFDFNKVSHIREVK